MESIQTKLTDEAFDELVHGGDYPELGDLKLAIKQKATKAGKPGVVIAFTIEVDGQPKKVQAVTTYAALKMAMAALEGSTQRGF